MAKTPMERSWRSDIIILIRTEKLRITHHVLFGLERPIVEVIGAARTLIDNIAGLVMCATPVVRTLAF